MIPEAIVSAVNSLLAPYGEKFSPSETPVPSGGYMSAKGAAAYLSLSRATFYRLVKSGAVPFVKLNPKQGGRVVFSVSDLDAFVNSRRAR